MYNLKTLDWLLELWSGHPQGFSLYPHVLCNLLRSVIKLCKLGRLDIQIFEDLGQAVFSYGKSINIHQRAKSMNSEHSAALNSI